MPRAGFDGDAVVVDGELKKCVEEPEGTGHHRLANAALRKVG
jgi:hypothetical protein